MTAVDRVRDGRCHLNLNADGSRITQLSAHVDSGTVMRAVEYPAESRIVLDLGDRSTVSVAVFLPAAELARLIDVLNAAYTRVALRPYDELDGNPRREPHDDARPEQVGAQAGRASVPNLCMEPGDKS